MGPTNSTNRKQRVCFYFGGREGGGVARCTLQMLAGLPSDRYEIIPLSCEDGPFTKQVRDAGFSCEVLDTGWPPVLSRLTRRGARATWSAYLGVPRWLVSNVRRLTSYLIERDIDLVHTNYYHFHAVAGLACKRAKRKCIWHWHGLLPVGDRGTPGTGAHDSDWRWRLVARLVPRLRRMTGNFIWSIANSEATADSVRLAVGDRMTLVYNGVSIAPPPAQRDRLRDLVKLGSDAILVGVIGSLVPIKGHRLVLEAAAKLCTRIPNLHFVFIGGQTPAGEQEYVDTLMEFRAKHKLDSRVHLLGHRSDAAHLVADLDMLVVATLPPGEGFGLVVTEAMAQKVPVIASRVGAVGEIITHGQSGLLFTPRDVNSLAGAIDDLAANPSRRKQLGESGYEVCCRRFELSRMFREIRDVYDRVLAM